MANVRPYRSARRADATAQTRTRIVAAAHDLLVEGNFHSSTVEDVAKRAGVSRATLYQHFGSRLGLVDAICSSFADNPSMTAIQASPETADPRAAVEQMVGQAVRFWASEESLHHHLYGLATIDDAAADFARRQTSDRRSVVGRIIARLVEGDALRAGLTREEAQASLMLLTSFATYEELRSAGLSVDQAERFVLERTRELLA